jgi:hypothetical protein
MEWNGRTKRLGPFGPQIVIHGPNSLFISESKQVQFTHPTTAETTIRNLGACKKSQLMYEKNMYCLLFCIQAYTRNTISIPI